MTTLLPDWNDLPADLRIKLCETAEFYEAVHGGQIALEVYNVLKDDLPPPTFPLFSAQQREPVVMVKELEWHRIGDCWKADRYSIRIDHGVPVYYIVRGCDRCTNPHDTLAEAKSAAQADYEQRIMAAIEIVAPSSTVEPTAHNSLDAGSSPAAPTISDGGSPGPSPLAVKQTSSDPASGRSQPSPDVSVDELADALRGAWTSVAPLLRDFTAQARALLARFRIERLDRLASNERSAS